tara:strand:- start:1561 stop:1899 length:339 start_codon:yes stop_codon:yes gene_type:complete
MKKLHEEKIQPLIIDLEALKSKRLDESFLRMFGAAMENVLGIMFDQKPVPLTVRGSRNEIAAFMSVLAKEKKYANSFKKFGLLNPNTFRSKYELNRAIEAFEKETGLLYPIH